MSEEVDKFLGRLFTPIGHFIVQFEYVCQELRAAGTHIFQASGLRNLELAEITFAGLTASPLLEVFVSLTSQAFTLRSDQINQLNEIRKRTEELITIRNRVIHSTWFFIDFADIEHGAPDGILTNKRRRRHGLDTHTSVLNRQELERLIAEAREIAEIIKEFTSSLTS